MREITETKEIMGIELNILKEIHQFCVSNNIKYFLWGGTLLGAIRHNGFIPWDDDVDVAMFQKDFDVLKLHADELWPEGSDFKLVCPGNIGKSAFLDFMNRLMYMAEPVETNTFSKAFGKADDFVEDKISLDIYVMNNAAPTDEQQARHAKIMQLVYGLGMGHRAFVDFNTYKKFSKFTQFVVRISSTIGKIVPLKFIIWLHEKLARKYDSNETDSCFESNGYSMYKRYSKSIFGDGRRISFYEKDVLVPEKTEDYLKIHNYHNYMEYPPVSARRPSHGVKSPDLA